jgi:hypothetical protein
MRYTLTWHPSAEQELANIWLNATDRQAITSAANSIDHLLEFDPLSRGEEFYGDRILVELPLTKLRAASLPSGIPPFWTGGLLRVGIEHEVCHLRDRASATLLVLFAPKPQSATDAATYVVGESP